MNITTRYLFLLLCLLVASGCTSTTPRQPDATQPPVAEEGAPEAVTGETPPATPEKEGIAAPAVKEEQLSQEDFIYRNEERLLRVYAGMSRKTVESIMSGYRTERWRNPCWSEKRIDKNGQLFRVDFYINRKPTRTRPMGLRVMLPVIYDASDRVDAISRYRLKKLRVATHLVSSDLSGCPGR